MSSFRVRVYSHHFTVTGFDSKGKDDITRFSLRYGEWKFTKRWDGTTRELTRVYAARSRNHRKYRFHITTLEEFLDYLQRTGWPSSSIEITHQPLYEPVKVEFKFNPLVSLRDDQPRLAEHLISPGKTKVITLQTGKGKTTVSLYAAAAIGQRFAVVIKGMYVDQWVKAMVGPGSLLGLKKEDVIVVRGSRDLQAVIELGKAGLLDNKVFVITNKTLYMYYDNCEVMEEHDVMYGCPPEVLWETLGVGVRLIDEVHQDFHLNFRQDLYSNVPKTISLSATLVSDNEFLNRMYSVMFPMAARVFDVEYHKYVAVKALMYNLVDPNVLRWKQKGRSTYSHVVFEESIMKKGNEKVLFRYNNMIDAVVRESYIKVRAPGQKMLIFCSTVNLCRIVSEFLQKKYPDLVVNKYTQEEDYDVLERSDIIVSTLMSAGTAVDIVGLRVCFSTTAIGSMQANLQALGRLRVLKDWPDVTPEFLYLTCVDIPQQMEYHKKKLVAFHRKVLSHAVMNLGLSL